MKSLGKTERGRGSSQSAEEQVAAMYRKLFRAWGRQHWWPAQSPFEVIVGAYLTQNTAWTNVELALKKVRAAGRLSVAGIRRTPIAELEQMVRSAGYFRQKARSLKNFVEFLDGRYGGSLARMFAQPTEKLREELLSLKGVGPETADSILLYAGNHPVFVVDAYTRRALDRHGILPLKARYEEIREVFEKALGHLAANTPSSADALETNPPEERWGESVAASAPKTHAPSRMSRAKRSARAQIYNEMHGLMVQVGKRYCLKSKALCEECPLGSLLPNK